MKLGVWLQAVAAHPRFPTPDWERTAGASDLAMIARTADELGYDCVCMPEHVALPAGRAEGTRYWDPLTTLGYLAAQTRRIRLRAVVLHRRDDHGPEHQTPLPGAPDVAQVPLSRTDPVEIRRVADAADPAHQQTWLRPRVRPLTDEPWLSWTRWHSIRYR